MAKQLIELKQLHAKIVVFPIVQCGCKRAYCGKIDINQHEWIYSKATEQYYTDMECMAHGIEAYYDPEHKAVFFEGWMTVEEFMKEMQAESNISYLPIA